MAQDKLYQDYCSLLNFNLVCSTFDLSESALGIETKTRTFKKVSTSLSRHGYWNCTFIETKKKCVPGVKLSLLLTWELWEGLSSQQESVLNTKEILSYIRSIKVYSCSTLSDILIDHIDGGRILEGDAIQVRLQSDRVIKGDRYKFRVAFYTQDISRTRSLQRYIFPSLLDIHSDFDPQQYWKDSPPDICFIFPASNIVQETVSINAHTSALCKSQYFVQRLAEIINATSKEKHITMVSYKVTEFPPQVFRVMLRYLYTGQLRFMDQNEECQDCSMSGVDQRQKKSFKVKDDLVSKVLKLRKHIEICRNDSVPVYFEDLFRISERYEIPTLKALSLKAMQCSLNLSVAILMLAKCEPQSKEESASELSKFPKTVLNRLQWLIAKDSVKEYIQFFGSEVNASETDQEPWQHISIQECRSMIDSLGNGVLANLYRFWG